VSDIFLPATSNVYSLDYVFDEPHCYHYQSGVHSPSFLNLGIKIISGEQDYRIAVATEFTPDPVQVADLEELMGYWRPLVHL